MVAVTRSRAARLRQLSNTENTLQPTMVSTIGKNKKKIVKQSATSSTMLLTTQSIAELTAVPASFDNSTPTLLTSASEIEPSHHHNSYIDDNVVNDAEPFPVLPSLPSDCIDDNQQDTPCEPDDEKELNAFSSWPVKVGEINWCKTNRGNDRMCMCGYTYNYISQSLKNNHRSFRCSEKGVGCRSIVYICINSNTYKGSNYAEHNHPPNNHNVKRLLTLQRVKDRVLLEPTSITRIIEEEYVKSKLNNAERRYFLLLLAQASRFHKIRAKSLPPSPKSLDFEVPTSLSTTFEGENFLIYDSTHKKLGGRLMIFSTKCLMKVLCGCNVILVDGTFKTRPTMFSQVYVITGQHIGEALPLVWCLTPKKTQEVYEKIFKILSDKAIDYGFHFQPQRVFLDFEIGTINALENTFPHIRVQGCFYHFTQCIYRNVQKIGLSSLYEKNESVKTWLKCFMALPLIRNTAASAALDYLTDNPPLSNNLLKRFIEYFQDQWVHRIPIKYWNLGPVHLRCNNSVEGYNNRLQHRFGAHPQLWPFIHFLKGEEALVAMRLSQIQSGNYREKAIPWSIRNGRGRKKTKQLKNLSRLYQSGTITLKKYITSLSFFVGESSTTKKKKNSNIIVTDADNHVHDHHSD